MGMMSTGTGKRPPKAGRKSGKFRTTLIYDFCMEMKLISDEDRLELHLIKEYPLQLMFDNFHKTND